MIGVIVVDGGVHSHRAFEFHHVRHATAGQLIIEVTAGVLPAGKVRHVGGVEFEDVR